MLCWSCLFFCKHVNFEYIISISWDVSSSFLFMINLMHHLLWRYITIRFILIEKKERKKKVIKWHHSLLLKRIFVRLNEWLRLDRQVCLTMDRCETFSRARGSTLISWRSWAERNGSCVVVLNGRVIIASFSS